MIARNALCAFCGAIVHEDTLTIAGECKDVERCAAAALKNRRISGSEWMGFRLFRLAFSNHMELARKARARKLREGMRAVP